MTDQEHKTYHAYGTEVWRTDEARDGIPTVLLCTVNPKVEHAETTAQHVAAILEEAEQAGHENEIRILHHMYAPLIMAANYARQLLDSIIMRANDGLFEIRTEGGEEEARACARHLKFALHAVNTMDIPDPDDPDLDASQRLLPHITGVMRVIFLMHHPEERQKWIQYVVASLHGLERVRDRALDEFLINGEGAGRPIGINDHEGETGS